MTCCSRVYEILREVGRDSYITARNLIEFIQIENCARGVIFTNMPVVSVQFSMHEL
jgi:hypothetical protein